MKLKSFKKKGVTDRMLLDDVLPEHYNLPMDQIEVDSKQRVIDIMWPCDNDGVRLDTGDFLALTIGDAPEILTARIQKVSKVGDRVVARIEEHQKEDPWTSKPLPSSRWKRFLTELKKKCDSGHHNKKRKTLLHVIKMARAIEAKPESIQLWLSERWAPNDAMPGDADLRAVVEKIRELIAEADTAGNNSLDLAELDELLEAGEIVTDAIHVPKREKLEAMTILMNGVSVGISETSSNKRSITISERALKRAVSYHTKQNGPVDLDEGGVDEGGDDLLDTTKRIFSIYVYSHDDGSIVYDNKPVKNITRSSNGLVFELQDILDAGLGRQGVRLDSVLLAITSYDPDPEAELVPEPVNSVDPETDLEKNKMLKISSDMYRFTSDVDTNKQRFAFEATFEASRQFQLDDTYFVNVGDTNAVFTVDSVVDGVTEEPKKAWIIMSHKGGGDLELFEFEAEQSPLIIKRLYEASPRRDAQINLILEKRHLDELPGDQLEEIADRIDVLIGEDPDQDGISVAGLVDWLEENHNSKHHLMVTGVEYNPRQPAYGTKSSVIGGVEIDVWMSARGKYSLFDIDPLELGTVESVSHISMLVGEEPLVKRTSFAQTLDEVRRQAVVYEVRRQAVMAEVDREPPRLESQIFRVSIYNGEKGYGVCINEVIYKILRKKKDGKCIYRIVVKNSVRANRIHHGKHRKCIMYLDQKTYVGKSEM